MVAGRVQIGQSATVPDVPSLTTVRALADGEPIEVMWVMVRFRTTRKNDFKSPHGPSDERGYVTIERSAVIESAQRDLAMFPMGLTGQVAGSIRMTAVRVTQDTRYPASCHD